MKKYSLICLFISILSFAQTGTVYHKTTTTYHKTTTKKKTTKPTVKTTVPPAGVKVWTIDAQRAKCEAATTMQCLLVKQQGSKTFELFYDNIQGFDYQEGYVYVIWVREEPKTPPIPANASVYNYTLVKVVSKKATQGFSNQFSENKKPLSGMTESHNKTFVVNEEKAPCSGGKEKKCLLVKEEGKKEFELLYQDIQGFTFEPGYRQTIIVNETYYPNAAVTDPQPVYTLVSVVSKVPMRVETPAEKVVPPVTTTGATVLDKRWFVKKMKDSDTTSYSIVDNAVWIEFNYAESKFTGNGPCNTFFGGFKSDLISSFQASAITGSKIYCANMALEDVFFTLLQNADRFKIENGKLTLFKGDRLLLTFE